MADVEASEPTYRVAVDLLSSRPHLLPRGAIVNGVLPDEVLAACVASGDVVADSGETPEAPEVEPAAEPESGSEPDPDAAEE